MYVSCVASASRFTALLLWLIRRISIERDHFKGDPPPASPLQCCYRCRHRCSACRTVHKGGPYRLHPSRPCGRNT